MNNSIAKLTSIITNKNIVYISLGGFAYFGICKLLESNGKFDINIDFLNQKFTFSFQSN